ncbi:MAG: phosphate ABC transporter ATP-binding protein [Cellulosilyticaceae bacterium]
MNKFVLQTQNLNVFYSKQHILKDVNLSIEKNKITAIIGTSGCGKSTLLKSFNRISEEVGGTLQGDILLDGIHYKDIPLEMLRRRIGLVCQSPVVFPFSIYKNMTYALKYHGKYTKKECDSCVATYLRKAYLYEEVKDYLKLPAAKLSGGQQQRLAIARALTINPEVLLLDEPCSALDVKNTAHIENLLLTLKNDYSIVIVTHNLAQAKRIADTIIFMEDGKIIESGSPDAIFNQASQPETIAYLAYHSNS